MSIETFLYTGESQLSVYEYLYKTEKQTQTSTTTDAFSNYLLGFPDTTFITVSKMKLASCHGNKKKSLLA